MPAIRIDISEAHRYLGICDGVRPIQFYSIISCGSRYIQFSPPMALKNTLTLKIPTGLRLLDHPGLKSDRGIYHFGSTDTFFVKGVTGLTVAIGSVVTLGVLMKVTAHVDWDAVFEKRNNASKNMRKKHARPNPMEPPPLPVSD